MIKLYSSEIVFREVPTEITLALNLSMCPHKCKGCHSPYLWQDNGIELTKTQIDKLIEAYRKDAITCVAFMGGDNDCDGIRLLNSYIHDKYPDMKTCWYTGFDTKELYDKDLMDAIYEFDYVKIGPYIQEKGGLDNPGTNQRFYKKNEYGILDNITTQFQDKGISKI